MKVYIVETGIQWEGSYIVGIYLDKDDAEKKAEELESEQEFEDEYVTMREYAVIE